MSSGRGCCGGGERQLSSPSTPRSSATGLPQSLCLTLQALAQGVCCGCYCRGHSCVVARVAAARILLAARWLCGLLCVACVIPGPSSVQGRGGAAPGLLAPTSPPHSLEPS